MDTKKCLKNAEMYYCKKCNFTCSKKSNFTSHTLTAKHQKKTNETQKNPKNALIFACDCGKEYTYRSGLWKHKKVCVLINKSNVAVEPNCISTDDGIEYKSMFLDLMSKNNELMEMLHEQSRTIQEQHKTISEVIPKIGNNNNNNTTNNNNQFNLQVFLNEDCKDALNFSEFIEKIQISFEDLENQADIGYVKGISQLFIETLKKLGTHKRPIHCTDKKRKTLYIKENNEWDKEGSLDTLKKGIQEVTRRTYLELVKSKAENEEEYRDADSEFSTKCLTIQKNLIPTYPRETSIGKVVENISKTSVIDEK
jgi:hypothetical protein